MNNLAYMIARGILEDEKKKAAQMEGKAMKKGQRTVIRAEYIDAGRKRTPDEQMMAITGMSIDEYVRKLQRNEGGLLDKVALSQ